MIDESNAMMNENFRRKARSQERKIKSEDANSLLDQNSSKSCCYKLVSSCDLCLMTLGLLTMTVAGDCRHLLFFVAFLMVLTPGVDAVL